MKSEFLCHTWLLPSSPTTTTSANTPQQTNECEAILDLRAVLCVNFLSSYHAADSQPALSKRTIEALRAALKPFGSGG
jgi:hypothetical protein